jgi:hypothetical protein
VADEHEHDDQAADDKAGDYAKPPTKNELTSMIGDIIDDKLKPFLEKLSGGDSKPAAPASSANDAGLGSNLDSMIDTAPKRLLGEQQSQQADAEHRKQHEQLAAAAERPPVERPRRARWLGNIHD